jgi:Parkin co-regulated protein
MRLHWDQQPSQLSYDPLLITCFEGLVETEHPFVFVARQGSKELLTADGAADKTIPLIPRLVMPLRVALMNSDSAIFTSALEILK